MLQEHRDLCCVCSHNSMCGYRGTPQRPKLFCEWFEVESAGTLASPSSRPPVDLTRGLCGNCDNDGGGCMSSGSGHTVWQCEEYC
jgi:hypothetical protein